MGAFWFTALVIGIFATALLDLWNLLLNRLFGFPLPNWGMVGRWFGHLAKGRFLHTPIAHSPAFRQEQMMGWIGHYLIGIVFAAALLLIWGMAWARSPTLMPALIVGWVTILCGWLILSPGLGNGFAAAKTANPLRARLLNVAGHTIFGLGLWSAMLVLNRAI